MPLWVIMGFACKGENLCISIILKDSPGACDKYPVSGGARRGSNDERPGKMGAHHRGLLYKTIGENTIITGSDDEDEPEVCMQEQLNKYQLVSTVENFFGSSRLARDPEIASLTMGKHMAIRQAKI